MIVMMVAKELIFHLGRIERRNSRVLTDRQGMKMRIRDTNDKQLLLSKKEKNPETRREIFMDLMF